VLILAWLLLPASAAQATIGDYGLSKGFEPIELASDPSTKDTKAA